jgi:uncharacterized membrane protein
MYTNAADYGTKPSPVTMTPIRWWAKCAFGRGPLLRSADRVEAWGLVVAFVAVVAAAVPAMALGHLGYAERAQTIAAESAARHSVQAVALSDSTADPAQVESTSTSASFLAQVRWTAQGVAHDGYSKVEQPVRAGQPVRIWLDDAGKVTTPPQTDADAQVDAMGTVGIVWLGFAALISVAMAMFRTALGRARDRRWDRGLQALVDDGGGSAAQRP